MVVVAGPPGSGKSSACARIGRELGLAHFSTGDVFRDAQRRGTALGREVGPYVERGDFVPDALAVAAVREWLQTPAVAQSGALLDGFPRTPQQAKALAAFVKVERLVLLQVCPPSRSIRCAGF